jgi:peptidoglycan/LPS O-acetylase OafA/YrhL
LTALRGIASARVVGFHVQPLWFPGTPADIASVLWLGQTAVDIFFVLSGFILACVYGALRLDRVPLFWLRRICRIYPLHLVVLGTFWRNDPRSRFAASATTVTIGSRYA